MISSDLLSAASLLVTLIALLYSTWYPDTKAAMDLRVARFRLDREPEIATVRAALFSRALPVGTTAVLLVVVLAEPALKVGWHALVHGWGRPYDPIAACFLLVWALSVLLAAATTHRTWELGRRLRELQAPDRTGPGSS